MRESDVVLAIVFTTLLILLLVAGIVIAFFLVNRQRIKQQMSLAQARITYEQELRQVETEVSEALREQFAQELHDNIGHILTCMRLEIENRKLDNAESITVLAPIENYLEEASQQLRLLSRSFNTDYITHLGLTNAIQLEVDRQQQLRKLEIHWEKGTEPPALDRNQELMTFRIFQEIVHNAIRHSKAKNLHIILTSTPFFELSIGDDGRGFSVDEILASSKASGLKNIIKRAGMAQLDCLIKSNPGQGCVYVLRQTQQNSLDIAQNQKA